jgi:hypothetical protein
VPLAQQQLAATLSTKKTTPFKRIRPHAGRRVGPRLDLEATSPEIGNRAGQNLSRKTWANVVFAHGVCRCWCQMRWGEASSFRRTLRRSRGSDLRRTYALYQNTATTRSSVRSHHIVRSQPDAPRRHHCQPVPLREPCGRRCAGPGLGWLPTLRVAGRGIWLTSEAPDHNHCFQAERSGRCPEQSQRAAPMCSCFSCRNTGWPTGGARHSTAQKDPAAPCCPRQKGSAARHLVPPMLPTTPDDDAGSQMPAGKAKPTPCEEECAHHHRTTAATAAGLSPPPLAHTETASGYGDDDSDGGGGERK